MEDNRNVYRPQQADLAALGISALARIPYGEADGQTLYMDCFYREDAPRPMPVVVWMHGGGFTEENLTRLSRPEKSFAALANRGYFIASIDYRLAQLRPFPAQIHDSKRSVRFLRANAARFGIDPDRIGVWGESCGGQLAGLMAVQGGIEGFEGEGWTEVSSDIQAAVSWYGGFDIPAFTGMHKDPRFRIIYGGSFEEKRELVTKASPIQYVKRKMCPILCMCSDTDGRVPDSQSRVFCDRATAEGNDARFLCVPNQGHGYFEGDEYYEKVYDFFDEALGRTPAKLEEIIV